MRAIDDNVPIAQEQMPNEGPVFVRDVRAEYHRGDVLGLGEPRPRLSWISVTDRPDWAKGPTR